MTSHDLGSFLERVEQIARDTRQPNVTNLPPRQEVLTNGPQISQKEIVDALHSLLRDQKLANSITVISGGTFMGDIFKGISGSTIINKSNVTDALNIIQRSTGSDVANALQQLGQMVHANGNKEIGELYESFVEEVAKPEPKKVSLRALWSHIESALPTVKTVADIAGTVTKLLT